MRNERRKLMWYTDDRKNRYIFTMNKPVWLISPWVLNKKESWFLTPKQWRDLIKTIHNMFDWYLLDCTRRGICFCKPTFHLLMIKRFMSHLWFLVTQMCERKDINVCLCACHCVHVCMCVCVCVCVMWAQPSTPPPPRGVWLWLLLISDISCHLVHTHTHTFYTSNSHVSCDDMDAASPVCVCVCVRVCARVLVRARVLSLLLSSLTINHDIQR